MPSEMPRRGAKGTGSTLASQSGMAAVVIFLVAWLREAGVLAEQLAPMAGPALMALATFAGSLLRDYAPTGTARAAVGRIAPALLAMLLMGCAGVEDQLPAKPKTPEAAYDAAVTYYGRALDLWTTCLLYEPCGGRLTPEQRIYGQTAQLQAQALIESTAAALRRDSSMAIVEESADELVRIGLTIGCLARTEGNPALCIPKGATDGQ